MTAAELLAAAPVTRPRIRTVIVNADDFGRSQGINRGVLEAFDGGIVTSASLMTMWPASKDAAKEALARPHLSVGLHVDLGEWVYRGDAWQPRYVRAPLDDGGAVAAEVARQVRAFRRLLDTDPTHIDSHQHVHLRPSVWSILCELADALRVPLRHRGGLVRYCGEFHGRSNTAEPALHRLTPDALRATLAGLGEGLTELVCHPGYAEDFASAYGPEREIEVRTLCDESVRATLAEEGIMLGSFCSLVTSNGAGGMSPDREVTASEQASSSRVASQGKRPSTSASAQVERRTISPELVLVDPTLVSTAIG
jgi:predicted glycoside hydrolase/deacetylase ChbG (UPF0249 family)